MMFWLKLNMGNGPIWHFAVTHTCFIWGYFYSNSMFPLFLQFPRPKWTIYKHVSDNPKNCLTVGNFGVLSFVCGLLSVFCSASAAYISLWRDLKYWLKVRYIILVYSKMTLFLVFETLCLGRAKTLPYVWK